jgi:hypothetical protein
MQLIQNVEFRTGKYKHVATIYTNTYEGRIRNYNIIIGGNYDMYVKINIRLMNGVPTYGIIDRADATLECSFFDTLKAGMFATVLRASIQFAHRIFPRVNIFIFDDASEIECRELFEAVPQRKQVIPYSLAHLSLSYYGKTWYERHLNAKMMHSCNSYHITIDAINDIDAGKENTRHIAYRNGVEALYRKHDMPFVECIYYDTETLNRIMQLYNASSTWIDFSHSIPKKEMAKLLFTWLPRAINMIIGTYTGTAWYIDVRTMPPIDVIIINYEYKEDTNDSLTRIIYNTRKQRARRAPRIYMTIGWNGMRTVDFNRGVFSVLNDKKVDDTSLEKHSPEESFICLHVGKTISCADVVDSVHLKIVGIWRRLWGCLGRRSSL